MTEKRQFDPDAALAALARAERAARPQVSERLHARVLADAAEVSAANPAAKPGRPAPVGRGWLGWIRGVDLWAGAAVAAAILCLAIGLGVGYGAGDRVLAEAGFQELQVAQAAEAGGGRAVRGVVR